MDDATYAIESQRIADLIHKWVPVLGLDRVHLDVILSRDGDDHARQGHHHATGLTTARWEYQWAEVSFDLSKTADNDAAQLEFVVLHELMHVMLQGAVSAFADDDNNISGVQSLLVERTATDLAQAFCRTQPAACACAEAGA